MKESEKEKNKGQKVNEGESSIQSNEESKFKKFKKTKIFKAITYIVVFFIGGIIATPSETPTMSNEEIESVLAENTSYESELSEANTKIDQLSSKVDSAKPWFEMEENEQKEVEKANEEKKIAEEKAKKKEAEEKKKASEEKEKKGYDTGITYKQLARTPDDYEGEKIKFNGKVIQVMEGDGVVQIRLAVGGDYDNIMLCEYLSSTVDSRVLEDDYITVYGSSTGLITYTSTMGGEITIPSMLVMKIDQ